MNTQTTTQESGRRLRGAALFSVLIALMLTLLLEALDQTIVGTALPHIISSLQGFDRYIWVVSAYTLASTTMIPLVGKLSDQFGRKWFLIIGTTIFLVGSALSGAAQTMNQLIAFRALQGLGGGIGIALVFTVVADIFPPAERARWQGIFGSVYGVANVIGPTLGGWLTDHGPLLGNLVINTTRWRWVFYINLPLGILALTALAIYLPTTLSRPSNRLSGWAAIRHIDIAGAALAAAATICLLLGLTWGSNQIYDWNSVQVIGVLIASGILYTAFILTERFVAEPILPLNLFRNRVFAVASILSLLQLMILIGLAIYLPFFLQGVLGESATNAGAVITPLTVSTVIGSLVASVILVARKRYQATTIVGAIIMTIGVFLLTRMTASTGLLEAAIYMVIAGIGVGSFFSILTLAAQNSLPRARLGVGTGAVRYLGQLGSVLGVTIVGTVVNQTLASDIGKRLPANAAKQLTPQGVKFATDPQALVNPTYRTTIVHTAENFAVKNATAHVPAGPQHNAIVATITAQTIHQVDSLLNQVFDALRLSFAFALQHGFVAILIFCLVFLVGTFFLKDVPMKKQYDESPAEAETTIGKQENAALLP